MFHLASVGADLGLDTGGRKLYRRLWRLGQVGGVSRSGTGPGYRWREAPPTRISGQGEMARGEDWRAEYLQEGEETQETWVLWWWESL
ncbi:hypothetical protein BY996DRAFT_6468704 [Phakopsora pachyrhizi]|nr:hypothetical protein BY996DRAFT_6468704 [Phakopsora pachyrhizi]